MGQQKTFVIDRVTPKNKIHSKHAKSLINHKLLELMGMRWATTIIKLIPDNVMLLYPSENLIWPLYKKK